MLSTLISPRTAFDQLRALGRALGDRGLVAARVALSGLAVYDTATLDEHAVARGAIEAAMARLCEAVVAPALWYLVLGMLGLCLYRALSIALVQTARLDTPDAAFRYLAARLDRLASIVPAILTDAVIALAALFVPGAAMLRAFGVMASAGRLHKVPSLGWTWSACAGALGLALAGPQYRRGQTIGGPEIGNGWARAGTTDIARAAYLYGVAVLVRLGAAAAVLLAIAG